MTRFGIGLYWLFVLPLLAVSGIWPLIGYDYPTVDLAETLYHVRELEIGRVPYRDMFSHHFLGYLYPFYLVSFFTELTPLAIKLISLFYHALYAVALSAAVFLYRGSRGALFAGAFAATIGWCPGWAGHTFNNQSYFLPLLMIYVFLVLLSLQQERKVPLILGALLSGIIVTFDQRLILYPMLLLIPVMSRPHYRRGEFLVSVLGAAVSVPLLCIAYLCWVGAFADFFQQTIVFPLVKRNAGLSGLGLGETLWLGARSEPVVSALGLVSLSVLLLIEKRRELKLVVSLLFLFGIVYIALGGRPYAHYFLILGPPLLLALSFLPSYLPRYRGYFEVLLLLLCFAFIMRPLIYWKKTGEVLPDVTEPQASYRAVAEYVRSNTESDEEILVWSYAPQIYLLSERFTSFPDISLLSVAGGNFFQSDLGGQGIDLEMLESFQEYLAYRRATLFIFHRAKAKAFGRSDFVYPQFHLDFYKNPHLTYLKNYITESCHKVYETGSAYDQAEIWRCR